MNDVITVEHTADVRRFVVAVREHLSDLTEEEREELVGGLDADMSDLVAEHGVAALPDPHGYASELRAAAGFSPEAAPTRGALRDGLMARLDRGAGSWRGSVASGDLLGIPAFLQSLRPAWWVLRALCAAALVAEIWASPGVYGFTSTRALVATVFVVVSVQIGRGAWWPGTMLRRSLSLRLVMIALNAFAVLMLPVMVDRFVAAQAPVVYASSVPDYSDQDLTFHGVPVKNIYPYDAQGRPLVGIQLVDQDGRRLMVESTSYDDSTGDPAAMVPWMNGRTQLFSVFPLAQRAQDPNTGDPAGQPAIQSPPFNSLPPVTMAGTIPSRLVPAPTAAERKAERKAARQPARKKAPGSKQAAAQRAPHRSSQ
ncbi:MAG: hypothetical protein ACXVW2_11480 [Nocardioidaceae bacterium]